MVVMACFQIGALLLSHSNGSPISSNFANHIGDFIAVKTHGNDRIRAFCAGSFTEPLNRLIPTVAQ